MELRNETTATANADTRSHQTKAPTGSRQRDAAFRPGERERGRSSTTPGSVTEQALAKMTERHVPGLRHRDRREAPPRRPPPGSARPWANVAMTHATMSWSVVVRARVGPRPVYRYGEPSIAFEIAAVLTPHPAASSLLVPRIASALRRLSKQASARTRASTTRPNGRQLLRAWRDWATFRVSGSDLGRLVGALSEPPGTSRFPSEHLRSEGQGGGWPWAPHQRSPAPPGQPAPRT